MRLLQSYAPSQRFTRSVGPQRNDSEFRHRRVLLRYWPDFCDGKILSFSYEAPDLLQLGISYVDADKARGAQIQLKFVGVSDVNVSELRSQNVIDALRLTEGNPNRAVIDAAYGLAGDFNFQTAEVISLLPNNSLKSDGILPQ